MLNNFIEKLENQGKIRKQKAGLIQVEALLKEALLDLEEAGKVQDLADRATYILAYNAMLKTGRALLLVNGYVPDDGGQHKTLVEVTTLILGPKFNNITAQFERMRRKRNELTYEAQVSLSKTEAKKAFIDAVSLVKEVFSEVKKLNPQFELYFRIKR